MAGSSVSLGLIALAFAVALWSSGLYESRDALFSVLTGASKARVHDATKNVTYLGTTLNGVEHFQNIFYAQDTAGLNRFAPPVPPQYASGTLVDATSPGAWCSQGTGDLLPFSSRIVNISENCLSLRVARPRGVQPDARLPVFVWLHGGNHALGSASEMLYTPDGLVKQAVADHQPIIYVAMNYRLGGVRDNIAVFGGDPKNVTAVGQSVGASDLGLHMTAFGGKEKPPFDKAILMSGAPGLTFNCDKEEVRDRTTDIAIAVGCVQDGDSQSSQTLECMRQASGDLLTNISVSYMRAARPPFGEGYFYPTVDGDFLPDRPSLLMRAGKFARDIPMIASWVSNEGAWYASPAVASDEDVTKSFGLWLEHLTRSTKSKLLKLYPVSDFEHLSTADESSGSAQYHRASAMNKDLWFTCPILDFVWQYAKVGGTTSASNIRLYEHNATRFGPVFAYMGVPMWRVAHLSDIPYVFNDQVRAGGDNSEAQMSLSRLLSSSIARFANAADPNGGNSGVGDWPLAFSKLSKADFKREYLPEIALHLFGGPYGTGPVRVRKSVRASTGVSEREQALLDEKLFERCDFINSDAVRRETGV